MSREEEKEEAVNKYAENVPAADICEEIYAKNGFRKGVEWADSHPSRELIEEILKLAYDWNNISWDEFVDNTKNKIWDEYAKKYKI